MATPGLTDDGIAVLRAADVAADFRADVEAELGTPIAWDVDTVWGTLAVVVAARVGSVWELLQAIYDAGSINGATGQQLDDLCALVGVTRRAATFSQAIVTLTGTAGTFISAGSLVEGGGADDRARWAIADDVTIGGGGTVSAVVVAEDAGAVVASTGQIDRIVTVVSGWTAVTNAAPASTGLDVESDADLRARRAASLQSGGARTIAGLRADLLALDGVQAAVVVDNPTATAATVEGVALDPHSFAAVVYPDTLTATQTEAVARAIYAHTPEGIASVGDEAAEVTDASGFTRTVRWSYATAVDVPVAVEVVLDTGYALADVSDAVEAAVERYFAGLRVGDDARLLRVLAAVAVEGVVGATVTLDGTAADVDVDLTQIARLDGVVVTEAP